MPLSHFLESAMRRFEQSLSDVPHADRPASATSTQPTLAIEPTRVENAIDLAVRWLVRSQHKDGFWVGNVDTNSCIEAQWLLASHIMGVSLPDELGLFRTLLQRQRPDGSWDIYVEAPGGDINSTVEVYAALRARGFDPQSSELSRARNWIHDHGGLRNVRVFTRYWLALIGVWPWEATPNLPPEIIRFPNWFPFSLYNFAQWARATIVPLAVISARRPVRPLPGGSKLEELFPDGYEEFDFFQPPKSASIFSAEWLFLKLDRILHALQNANATPGRETAIKLCLEWMIHHQDADGTWGGIQPPWIYGLIALTNEGYPKTHPVVDRGVKALSSHWSFERDGARHIQATESSVWDTLLTLVALQEVGCSPAEMPEMQMAISWILDQQVLLPGDWAIKVKGIQPGGWAFERANNFYPDVDDTAVALLALAKARGRAGKLNARIDAAIDRGLAWTLAMQSSNGGWAAFDKDNDKEIICKIPFCNYGEALDPPSVDVTGHVLEAFGALGIPMSHPAVARALDFIRSEQEEDGSWFGRWGVNHIYGTGAVLPGLRAIGEDMSRPYVRKAAEWIVSRQNIDGGWGESCASYMDPQLRGVGPSTPSQSAWAIMALVAVGADEHRSAISGGIQYLCDSQDGFGTWAERHFTATGFPGYGVGSRNNLNANELSEKLQQGTELSRGFMINFNMYRHYFPLLALGRGQKLVASLQV
jgi:squalene-hopene/tetraprenyl-beta-curcumene cyclase